MSEDRRYAALTGGDVHVRVWGSGPPVVLLHDSPGSGAALTGLARALAGDFQVVVPDLPGHGGSASAGQTSMPAVASDVAEALRLLGIRRAPVAGTGVGGAVAAQLAATAPDVCAVALADDPRPDPGAVGVPAAGLGGGALLDAWWAIRRAGMFRAWSDLAAPGRSQPVPAAPADLHATVVDALEAAEFLPYQGFPVDAGPVLRVSPFVPEALVRALSELPAGRVEPSAQPPAGAADGIRCSYQRVRGGLIHLRRSGVATDRAPVVVLPSLPGSGAGTRQLMDGLARTRTVVAVDYPGHGRSDPMPPGEVCLADYVDVLDETAARAGWDGIDVVGVHSGALLAALWQRRYPGRIRALALDGLPVGRAFAAYDLDAYLPDLTPDADGHHLLSAWAMASDRLSWSPWYDRSAAAAIADRPSSLGAMTGWTVDLLRGAGTYGRLYRLVLGYRIEDDPPAPGVPTLLCRTAGDPLEAYLDTAVHLLPHAVVRGTHGSATPAAARDTADVLLTFFRQAASTQESA